MVTIRQYTYGFQRLVHFLLIETQCLPIIFHSNAIIGLPKPFQYPELHLRGQMIKPILRRLDQF